MTQAYKYLRIVKKIKVQNIKEIARKYNVAIPCIHSENNRKSIINFEKTKLFQIEHATFVVLKRESSTFP